MITQHVPVGQAYDVLIGAGILDELGPRVAGLLSPRKAAVITDEAVVHLYGERARASLEGAGLEVRMHVFGRGEECKTMDSLGGILEFLAVNEFTRTDVIVALGGGITGDLAGFAASCYLRGIPLVQVPTTLLAAVDSSVGGKTAVNLQKGKNLAGTFYQPRLVVCDPDVFNTLRWEDYLCGLAESLKYGVLCDPGLFHQLKAGAMETRAEEVIARCVEIKAQYVLGDERDEGERQMLNLGHTFAHSLETCSGYTVPHGLAVAIGMVTMAKASYALGVAQQGCAEAVLDCCAALGLPTATALAPSALARAAMSDKKRRGDTITLVLPERVGKCVLYDAPSGELEQIFALGVG